MHTCGRVMVGKPILVCCCHYESRKMFSLLLIVPGPVDTKYEDIRCTNLHLTFWVGQFDVI